ncbi:MAG: hypothetical protein WA208_04340 [Thermoanaerobaculia bacterium]
MAVLAASVATGELLGKFVETPAFRVGLMILTITMVMAIEVVGLLKKRREQEPDALSRLRAEIKSAYRRALSSADLVRHQRDLHE